MNIRLAGFACRVYDAFKMKIAYFERAFDDEVFSRGGKNMIEQAEIEKAAKAIGEAANAERVVLFGSYANGQTKPDSDVDFLVVAESDMPRHKRSRALYGRIRPLQFALDIIVYTPDEVRRGCRTPVSFVSQILREGKTVYAR